MPHTACCPPPSTPCALLIGSDILKPSLLSYTVSAPLCAFVEPHKLTSTLKLLALLLSLSLLVVTHELGHLGFAKLFGVRVRRFYMFFNPGFSLFKAKKFGGKWHFLFFNKEHPAEWDEQEPDNTLWGIGWLPLGGYCDIAGMIDETKGADQLEKEPQPWEYRSKPAWQRLCIISGGVLVNFISALLIYSCIFAHWGKDELPLHNASLGYDYHEILHSEGLRDGDIIWSIDGQEVNDFAEAQQQLLLNKPTWLTVQRTFPADSLRPTDSTAMVDIMLSDSLQARLLRENPPALMSLRMPFVVREFVAGSAAKAAGLMEGDSIVSIAGEPTTTYFDVVAALSDHASESITVDYFRADSAGQRQLHQSVVQLGGDAKLGIFPKDPIEVFNATHTDYTLLQAIPVGIKYGWETLATYVSSMKLIFTKEGAKSLGGFGTLGSMFPRQWDWLRFWNITALLAIVLAFMNIIPIPGLDGGHILFTLWELITRRKPSDRFLEVAQSIGMILLLVLLVWANGNDLIRWISKWF